MVNWRSPQTVIKVQEIYSDVDCPAQVLHMDHDYSDSEVLSKKNFSLIIALQPGTTWIDKDQNTHSVPLGSMIIWDGDFPHSGGLYVIENRRVFVRFSNSREKGDPKVYTDIEHWYTKK